MSNTAFGWLNQVKTAALSVGSAAANMGAGNLQIDQGSPDVGWQTASGVLTDAAGAWLLIDSGNSATVWRAFGLFRGNLSAAATVRWRVGSALSGGRITTASYDSGTIAAGVLPGYLQSLVVAPADQVGRYCEVDINDSANPDAFINIPLAYAGPLFMPTVAASFSSTVGRTDQTDEVVTLGGQEFPMNRYVQRVWSVNLARITIAETWASVMELDRVCRAGGNVLFAPDVTSAHLAAEAVFGRVKSPSAVSYPYGGSDSRAWTASLTERL